MQTNQPDKLLSVKEVAEIFGCSIATIWRRSAVALIPKPIKLGNTTRWSRNEIFQFLDDAKSERAAA